jgi:hypothetical protein
LAGNRENPRSRHRGTGVESSAFRFFNSPIRVAQELRLCLLEKKKAEAHRRQSLLAGF